MEQKGDVSMSRIISIANQKGGVGKTTTNVNLSACLADKGKRILVIDIDPQGNTTSGFGIEKELIEYSIYDVLINGMDINKAIVKTEISNLDIIISKLELAGAEIELVPMMARETILKKAIGDIEKEYDYIFIDCPPSLGLLTINALIPPSRRPATIACKPSTSWKMPATTR